MADPELPADLRLAVSQARIGRLATVTPTGSPHVVPVCFAAASQLIYMAVDHKPKSTPRLRRLENIRATPEAELVVDHYEDDWRRLWWVRARGVASIVELDGPGSEEAHQALEVLAAKYAQYRRDRPDGPVIRLAVTLWTYWRGSPAAASE